jgi:hypothetical protein
VEADRQGGQGPPQAVAPGRRRRYTRWFKYDWDYLCVNKSQFVPAIFEPPCIYTFYLNTHSLTPRRYNPCRVLADSSNSLQPTLSLVLLLQFLTPSLSASLITPSIHLRFGLPTHLLPSGLSKVIFLHGRLSCIHTICPAHLGLDILMAVTKSISSYR